MSLLLTGNWVHSEIRTGMDAGESASAIAERIGKHNRVIDAIQHGIDGDNDSCGGDGADAAVVKLIEAFGEPGPHDESADVRRGKAK